MHSVDAVGTRAAERSSAKTHRLGHPTPPLSSESPGDSASTLRNQPESTPPWTRKSNVGLNA